MHKEIDMENKKFKPLFDRLYLWIIIPTAAILAATTVLGAFHYVTLFFIIPVDLLVLYFLISPAFGYVELRKETLIIKYGFFLKKEIPYNKIRKAEKDRKFYSESMTSLKCALEHVNIKYNKYDVTTVSVIGNDDLVFELEKRRFDKTA